MQNEVWKDIPSYEGIYQVSNLGRVKSLSKEKMIRGKYKTITKEKILSNRLSGFKGNQYLSVALYNNGRKQHKVHVLVAMAFLGHKVCGHKVIVDHLNNDKLDNNLNNLQLISQRNNSSKDKKNKSSKYTGVCWVKDRNKWMSGIRINGKLKYLGLFKSEHDAHTAYQNKLKEIEQL